MRPPGPGCGPPGRDGADTLNRYHQRLCRSPDWAAYVADSLVPRALDGVPLGDEVLELGPGYGASTQPLAERTASLTALESDPELASRLRARLGQSVTVVDGDATSMTFGDSTFSAVVCFTMLHHLPSAAAQDRLFAEAARVLVPGGVFAGTDSQPSWRFRLIHLADTCNPVDPGTLAARLTTAGFGQIQIDTSHRAVSFVARAPATAR
jgi:SAM-dependent methyltransferase